MSTRNLEERLLRAVHELSRSGELPIARGGTPADVLAERFDQLYADYVASLATLPDESRLVALQTLDSSIHAITGVEFAALWKEPAVRDDPRWHEVRSVARAVLEAFDR